MIIEELRPPQVVLQVVAQNLNGSPKKDIASGEVRVYHVDGGSEVEDLPWTPLARVGVTSVWRCVWEDTDLVAGQYVAEYHLVDNFAREFFDTEDLVVRDFALQSDVTMIRQVETGRWRVVGNQMLFYADDGETVILRFNLKDSGGQPTMDNVFERVPVA